MKVIRTRSGIFALSLLSVVACTRPAPIASDDSKLLFPGEIHFKNIRQFTHEGTNAEAYWSFDGKLLTFQRKGPPITRPRDPAEPAQGFDCDQIYTMKGDGTGDFKLISKNLGRNTCSYFLPSNERILFASTFETNQNCPAPPDMSKGYVWPIYNTYQIYTSTLEGSDVRPLEAGAPRAYNAEATVCKDGSVIFTSDRDGDLDLYTGKLDSFGVLGDVKRITNSLGYDGGAFYSQDCKKIVWRASRPRTAKEKADYLALLKRHLVRPRVLEIWVADADGSHAHQVTRLGAASFAPFYTPDSKQILFASNPRDPLGRHFDLYRINTDGTGLERLSFSNTFESFPMFSPDGKRLAFSSNRNAGHPHETNIFVADWVDGPHPILSTADPDPVSRIAADVEQSSAPMLIQRWGKCRNTRPILITVDDGASVLSRSALAEVARRIQAAPGSRHGCFLFGSASARARHHPKATLIIGNVDKMESNQVAVSVTGSSARFEARVTEACESRAISCTVSRLKKSPSKELTVRFETGPGEIPVNYTGVIQASELVSDVALRMAGVAKKAH